MNNKQIMEANVRRHISIVLTEAATGKNSVKSPGSAKKKKAKRKWGYKKKRKRRHRRKFINGFIRRGSHAAAIQ